jgi:succinate dehydrogenase/fumarate reductase flavoprotein subunit
VRKNEFDVVVLGTGAAGMVAAVAAHDAGASVAIFEKADVIGGTTALSGGVCWMPFNRLGAAAGLPDSRADALAYLASLSHGLILPELAEAFVDGVPEVIDYLEGKTPLRFQLLPIPDYHPEHAGGRPRGGRSIEPTTTAFDELGDWGPRIGIGQFSDPETGDVYLTTLDSPRGGGSGRIDEAEMERRRQRRVNGRGRGMIGALLKACLERGFAPVTGASGSDLVMRDGRVIGVRIVEKDRSYVVYARGGVVLATGGFEWDPELALNFLRGPMRHPASIPTNTGDGLKMAMRAGAKLGNMREAWWMPVVKIPGAKQYGEQKVALILRERTLPGTIMVNRRGRRFVNEATNYNAIAGAFHHFDPMRFEYGNLPCWLVFDNRMIREYGFLDVPAGGTMPDWVPSASTLAGLADAIGVPSAALEATVARWNADVAKGTDPDFGRGDSAYDGFNGDISRYPSKEATLGTIGEPPYYAIEIECSTLGTKGGPRTDRHGMAVDLDAKPMHGLYAVGNAMAGPTGMAYGGAGGTLGPAIVFGYLAGRHAASHAISLANLPKPAEGSEQRSIGGRR